MNEELFLWCLSPQNPQAVRGTRRGVPKNLVGRRAQIPNSSFLIPN